MLVTVEGFGSIWSKRVRQDPGNPGLVRKAYYNTTGILTDGELRHRSKLFAQLRFNQVGGFNPTLVERNLGRVFHCICHLDRNSPNLVFHHLAAEPMSPDYFLFAVNSNRTGVLPISTDGWKSDDVLVVSFSQFHQKQEAILLMPARSWIRGALGSFVAEPLADFPWRAFLRLTE